MLIATNSNLITLAGNTTASGFVELILNARGRKTVSEIKGLRQFSPPYRLGFGASVSQRQFGEITVISVSEVDATGARIIAAGETESFFGPDLTINKISVTSNVAVVTSNVTVLVKVNPFAGHTTLVPLESV